ncbi:peptide-methionine (S)-S-oxide reductase MsrA [Aurantivibrio plasticivorans]
MWRTKLTSLPAKEQALPGRREAMAVENKHYVHGRPIQPPFPQTCDTIVVGMGCFWGVERLFWALPGAYTTAVGYAAGLTPNPTYEEVCTGYTGHNEVALIVYDPAELDLDRILQVFWESHDPTQGMRQGNDRGTQYRSGIYTTSREQYQAAVNSRDRYQQALNVRGLDEITTEIMPLETFYYAEGYHQQYLAKNPGGYCGLQGTGVSCPSS